MAFKRALDEWLREEVCPPWQTFLPAFCSTFTPTSSGEAFFRPASSPGEGEAGTQNSPVSFSLVIPLMPTLIDTPAIFCGGKFFHDRLQWCHMPSDKWIHDVVHGKFLVFVSVPIRRRPPGPLYFSTSDRVALVSAMVRFLGRGIVECKSTRESGFLF